MDYQIPENQCRLSVTAQRKLLTSTNKERGREEEGKGGREEEETEREGEKKQIITRYVIWYQEISSECKQVNNKFMHASPLRVTIISNNTITTQ